MNRLYLCAVSHRIAETYANQQGLTRNRWRFLDPGNPSTWQWLHGETPGTTVVLLYRWSDGLPSYTSCREFLARLDARQLTIIRVSDEAERQLYAYSRGCYTEDSMRDLLNRQREANAVRAVVQDKGTHKLSLQIRRIHQTPVGSIVEVL